MKNIHLIVLFLFGSLMVTGQNSEIPSSVKNVETKVDSVLALMTLEEKVGQLVQYNGSWDLTGPASEMNNKEKEDNIKNGRVGSMLNVLSVEATAEAQRLAMENSRLKIPMMFGYDVIHGYKTMFPVPLGETASWDLEAMEESARIAALESVADGVNWTFSPMIDVSRDARWGRIMESSGEDPYLTAQVAVAKVKGYQGNDLADEKTIAATAKHFAGYGFAEAGRDYNTVHVGENELHNTILPPFKAAAKAGVATFMNAFNDLDGTPATGHKVLQRDILKGDWNWDGLVVSDWGSIIEMVDHGFARDKKHAAEIALNAGSDVDMEGGAYESSLVDLVEEGKVSLEDIDDAVRRVLRVKFKMGLFEDPYRYSNPDMATKVPYEEHRAAARDIAKKSIVLLKNENELLPLKSSVKNIAVIGPLANDKDTPIGNWRAQGEANSAVSVLEGIKNAVGDDVKVTYAKGADLGVGERSFLMPLKINTTDRSGFEEAITTAAEADLVVMALGEDAFQSGEGRSQVNIGLAGLQEELLKEIHKVNKNIVLVLINGRPLEINWASQNVPAIAVAWQLGSESGNAIADVLFGKYNPSGKLPVSFPRAVGQEPLYYNQKNTGRPSSEEHVTYSAYTDERNDALYPFGFGLSYTDFEYGALELSSEEMEMNGSIRASINLTNTGDVEGKEIVQLYIRDLVASTTRPVKELKGFEAVTLAPGESKRIDFTIDEEMLKFYNANDKWEAEAGDFEVLIGGNSRDLQKAGFTLKESKVVFEDHFEGEELNMENWNYEEGDGCPNLCGWGNNERQGYYREFVKVEDGKLIITAVKEGDKYFSGKINTKDKVEFKYGSVEVRAKLPAGHGLWPAIWMLGNNIEEVGWPASGEIDIMEFVGRQPDTLHNALHTPASHGETENIKSTPVPGITEDFQVFRMDWSEDAIEFFINDEKTYTFSPEVKNEETYPYNHPFYLLLNLAIGGNFGGPEVDDSIFPAEFIIDYVKVTK
ncbi:beta-glucosidase BglX [Salegentibacter sediminis]|uniref:beta-glucosidase BglX n=1 Tax=Salegentibacter sediminis TaxID=1930251 RepID=UPI0009BDFDAE|nr:beta-glucosidase BglX [Salegentibacter sediminis]